MPTGIYIPSANQPILGQNNNYKLTIGNINLHPSNTLYSKNNIVAGTGNIVNGQTNVLCGSGHNIQGSNCFITGQSHSIIGNSVLVLGGNAISTTADNLLIIGDDCEFHKNSQFDGTASFLSPVYGLPFQNLVTDATTAVPAASTHILYSYTMSANQMVNDLDNLTITYTIISVVGDGFVFKFAGLTYATPSVLSGQSLGTLIFEITRTSSSSFRLTSVQGQSIFQDFSGVDYTIPINISVSVPTSVGAFTSGRYESIVYRRRPY